MTLGADRPDAAPRRLDNLVRMAAHGLILLCVVVFVGYYCVWAPISRRMTEAFASATVMSVANPVTDVRAPDVTGVFRAERPLANGARVRKGQLLGWIESPGLVRDIDRAAAELRGLQSRQLHLQEQCSGDGVVWQVQQEARELAARVASASQLLGQLEATRSQLTIYAPADGFVHIGLGGSMSITPYLTIVGLYPEHAEMLIEVTAPLEVLNVLERRGLVTAEFETALGSTGVEAKPIRGSARPFTKISLQKGDETWGVLQCVPLGMPAGIRLPGLIGKLH
jgi:hypothetical protein